MSTPPPAAVTEGRTVGEAVAAMLAGGDYTPARGRVEVPIPPSTNNLYATVGRRRIPTREYKAWREAAGPVVRRLAPATAFPVELRYTLTGKVNALRDIGNVEKALTDQLVFEGVLPGDRLKFVGRIVLSHEPDEGEPRVVVQVIPAADAAGATREG